MRQLARALWRYRGFILGSVRRDFEVRYVRSVFGFLWAVIEPLSMILVYTLVFSRVMRARLPGTSDGWAYSIYLCAGILTWGFFIETLNRCQTLFLDQSNLLKKSNFPRATLPVIVLMSATINFLIIFAILLVFLIMVHRFPGWDILWFVPLLMIQQGFAMGLGMVTGTLNVFFRDIGKSIGVALTFWFWITPIVYPMSIIPKRMQEVFMDWNPLVALVRGYQSILLGHPMPALEHFYMPVIVAIASLGLGYYTFMQFSNDLVDEL